MPHEEPPALPPGLDLLWGRRALSRRGPKPGLSVEVITDAAIRIADAEGLDAVSMARVANTLGFTTMSLYRYIESKEQLLQLMWNASAQGAERFVAEGDSWRDRLRMWALVQREVLDRHRWITDMPMAAPPLRAQLAHLCRARARDTRRDRARRWRQTAGPGAIEFLHAQRGPDGPRRSSCG